MRRSLFRAARYRPSRSESSIVVDLRSDTVTLPSEAMRDCMRAAPVGDDVMGEDETINALESRVASMCGKDGALFVPSGTMGNLVSVGSHCTRGDEMILGTRSHILLHEAGSPAALLGVSPMPVPNADDGTIPLEAVRAAIRVEDPHYPTTRLLTLETTQNECGGVPLSLAYLAEAGALCRSEGLRLHVDGARLFNAAVAQSVGVDVVLRDADTATFCLSKGLGCPVGSVVVGDAAFIRRARRMRKALGGGMRQAGILAAAGLHALEHNVARLADDHRRARALADTLRESPHVSIGAVETNIVWFDILGIDKSPEAICQAFKDEGVLISGGYAGPRDMRFRAVTHLDVDDEGIAKACDVARRVLA